MDTIVDRLRTRFGERMTLPEVSEVLRIPYQTLQNKRCSDSLPFKTHKDGLRVFAMTDDVANHLERFLE